MGKTDIFIGIDIGSSSIKLAELKKIRDAFYVEKALISEFELDESTLKAVQSQDAVREIVKAQLKNIPKKTKKVCISVWGQSAFIRFIKLPKVDKKELARMIKFEAQQQVPFPIEEVIWDYQVFPRGNTPEFDILLVAVKNKIIHFLLDSLKQAGIDIEIVDASSLACLNTVKLISKQQHFIIVDIGAKTTDVIIQDDHNIWTRSIALGGNDITKSLMVHYNINFKQAEERKRKEVKALVSQVGKVIDAPSAPTESNEANSVIAPILTSIINEVSNSIGFYKSQFAMSKNLQNVFLTGGTSNLPNLDKLFESNLNMPVEKISIPSKNSKILTANKEELVPGQVYAPAIGLALRGFDNATDININLLPNEEKIFNALKKKLPGIFSLIVVALIAFMGIGYAFNSLNGKNKLTVKDLNSKKQELSLYDKQLNKLNKELESFEEQISKLIDIQTDKFFHTKVLGELAKVIPKELWLTKFSRSASSVVIEGKVKGAFIQIADFKDKLEKSKMFKDVEIVSANVERSKTEQPIQDMRVFTIRMELE